MKIPAKSISPCMEGGNIKLMVCPKQNDIDIDLVWMELKKPAAKKLAEEILSLLSRKSP